MTSAFPTEVVDRLLLAVERGDVLATTCPSRAILQHLTNRWGTLIMLALSSGTLRFSDLRRRIGGVSERMLAQTLQQLEADGMVRRVAHNVVPPHVDYSLTPIGTEAALHVANLVSWIETSLPRILAKGARADAA